MYTVCKRFEVFKDLLVIKKGVDSTILSRSDSNKFKERAIVIEFMMHFIKKVGGRHSVLSLFYLYKF